MTQAKRMTSKELQKAHVEASTRIDRELYEESPAERQAFFQRKAKERRDAEQEQQAQPT